jgi:hypothetical protein
MKNTTHKYALTLATLATLVLCAGWNNCPNNGNKGDITIAQTDATAPTISLAVAVVGGNSTTTVNSGGNAATLTLTAKTVKLNVLATAKDQESGIQAFEIWVGNQTHVRCDPVPVCATTGPGLTGQPMWSSITPKLNPGDRAVSTSIMAESLDPVASSLLHPAEVPPVGGTLTESFTISAKATNHLGGSISTPDITVISKLP